MENRKVQKISRSQNTKITSWSISRKRVAAYARVSTSSAEQMNSVAAQEDFFEKYIQSNPEWIFAGLYADEGITGTSVHNRAEFNRLISDALDGKIDYIVTKSISRFARNTVDTLQNIRLLKSKGIGVFFFKENIDTLDSKGEFMITILSSLAQEESRSISENVTWGIRKRMADGTYKIASSCGFKKTKDGSIDIDTQNEYIVRLIYALFLSGNGITKTCDILNMLRIPTAKNCSEWKPSTVRIILSNEKNCGDVLFQKKFCEDFITKKIKKNRGEVPQYLIIENHKGIIAKDVWEYTQNELAHLMPEDSYCTVFSNKLVCGNCGRNYGRHIRYQYYSIPAVFYYCRNKYNNNAKCYNPIIYEQTAKEAFSSAVFSLFKRNRNVLTELNNMLLEMNHPPISFSAVKRCNISEDILSVLITKAVLYSNRTMKISFIDGSTTRIKVPNKTPRSYKK